MSRLHICAAPGQGLWLAVGLAALIVAATAVPDLARADNSAVEPEVGAPSTLPGMPPAPSGAPPIPAAASHPSAAAAPQPANAPAHAALAKSPPPANEAAVAKAAPTAKQIPIGNEPSRTANNDQPPAAAAAVPAEPSGATGLAVINWSLDFRPDGNENAGAPLAVHAGQPLYLRLTVQGGQAAVDWLRTAGGIPIVVHWTRSDGSAGSGAPDLTSRLTVGRPGIASALAGEVMHTGHFDWHTWTSKSTLSPGQWNVSLTYPDGRPLTCGSGSEEHPCRFSIDIG